MELDELIRESSPTVGEPPTLVDLRAGARRRRARRARVIGAALVVAVVALVVPFLLPGDETDSTVAVRPHPVGRTLSAWSRVAEIPTDPDVATPTQIELVESEGEMFVITHEESDVRPADNWIRVASLQPGSGALTDLGYETVRPVGSFLQAATGWRGGPAIVASTVDGWFVDHWTGDGWESFALPLAPENATTGWSLATIGTDLVATTALMGTVDGSFEGVVDDRAWSTGDGRTWTELPAVPDSNGYGVYSTSAGSLVRQGFSPVTTGGSMTSVLAPEATEWAVVPPPAFSSHGSLRSAEVGDVLLSCGTDELRYDCSRWSPGDDAQQAADPPPFEQGGWQEARGEWSEIVAVPDRGVLMTDGYGAGQAGGPNWALYDPDDDRWRALPDPQGARVANVVVVNGDVYAAMYDPNPAGDGPPGASMYRLEVGEDDPEMPRAVEVGDGYRVRLPSDRWTATADPDGSGIAVSVAAEVGAERCPGLRVELVEGETPSAPSPYARLELPESTPPCAPSVFNTILGGRPFTMRVYRSVTTESGTDAADLLAIIGSFRAAAR